MSNVQPKINNGGRLTVLHLNIEGSSDKSEFLSRKASEYQVDMISVQETHIQNAGDYHSRGNVAGYNTAAYLTNSTYGIVTYVRQDHRNYNVIHVSQENDVSCIVVELLGIKVTNVYKPPNQTWPENVLYISTHPAVYVGDFNSHNTVWGYANNNENCIKLMNWADSLNLYLVHDAKDLPTF